MSTSAFHSATGKNDGAEGTFVPADFAPKTRASRTGTAPVVRLENHTSLAAETGILHAVVAEGQDNTETQDACRTTAEQAALRPATPSVLIVEDSTELAEIIEATLQRLNMVTVHETHGNKAFSRYEEARPDVILLDIGLPDMIGWKVLEHIRETSGERGMPKVVIITAYGDPANRLIGKLQNVHEYLVKPFTADEVERVVLNALGSAGR